MRDSANTKGPVILVCKDISYAFPFGIAYLAGYLRQKREDVRVLFKPEDSRLFPEFARRIAASNPLVAGFGSLYPDLYAIKELVRILDSEGRCFPIVVGGQMVSPTPEFAVQVTGADYGVLGEGEIIFHELVTALRERRDPAEVKGLVIRDGTAVYPTGAGEYLHDLSKLPPVPYDLFPTDKWLRVGRAYVGMAQPHWRYNDRVLSLHGGRGCPFKCNFCYHHSKARYRSISDMMAEARELAPRFQANMLYFGDDLVLADPRRAREVTEALAAWRRPMEYSVSTRFDVLSRIDDRLLQEMKRTGCRIMGLGIESGSQRILDVMHKRITVEQIVTGLRRLKKAGILPTVSIMVGQLTETVEDVKKSMALMVESVRENKNIEYGFTITTPFPGSELYSIALQKGTLKDHYDFFRRFDPSLQVCKLSVNLSAMSDEEVQSWHKSLQVAFRRAKEKAIGRQTARVESLRRQFARGDSVFRRRIIGKLPLVSGLSALLQPYEWCYDFAQTALDKWRLRTLGIRE